MQTRLGFIAGGAVGYVLGAAAGRQRYEQIKRQANTVWSDPRVQQQVSTATDKAKETAATAAAAAKEKAPVLQEKAASTAAAATAAVKEKAPQVQAKVADAASTAGDKAKHVVDTAKAKVGGGTTPADDTPIEQAPVQLADAADDIEVIKDDGLA